MTVDPSVIAEGVNLLWVALVCFLIFFMHAGFAMLESGQVRAKNVANQLTKNLLTWSIGIVAYFFVGFGIEAITGGLTGSGSYGLADLTAVMTAADGAWITDWLFGAVFAMTAATIVSGAVAGRVKLRAYVSFTLVLAAIIYPVVVGFTWAGGFLDALGFHDFAGGMIVHGMGGIAGLTAASVIGPRLDRYSSDGRTNVIPGHSMTFAVLGTLVLAFGWYGFNVGTTAAVFAVDGGELVLSAGYSVVGRVALATTVGMAWGAIGASVSTLYLNGKVDTLYVANGLLAGLVAVTGIADVVTWWGAMVVALLAGLQLPFVFRFVSNRVHIDDVCAVFPVHGSAGALGVLALPFVHIDGFSSSLLVAQIIGVAVITLWTVGTTAVVFGIFAVAGQARVSAEHEHEGLDSSEHGVDTYPEFGKPDLAADGGRAIRSRPTEDVLPRSREDVPSRSSENLRTDGGRESADIPDSDGEIKLVMAMIRPDKLGAVKHALAEIGAPSLTVTSVSGRGSQSAKTSQWRGEEYTVDLHEKIKLECVVAEVPVADVVTAIRKAAATGEPGDGKVFVMDVEAAVQIRTGVTGPEAV